MEGKETDTSGMDTPPQKNRADRQNFLLRLFDRLELPVILTGIFILCVLIAFLLLLPGRQDGREGTGRPETTRQQLDRIERRLEGLESRIAAFNEQAALLEELGRRLETLETTVSLRLDSIAKRMDLLSETLAREPSESRGGSTAAPGSAAAVSREPASGAKHIHTVRPGETVYSISRRYNLSVEAIMQLNGLGAGDAIFPGQQLRVTAE